MGNFASPKKVLSMTKKSSAQWKKKAASKSPVFLPSGASK
jgi:hypothetical protein